MLLAISLTIVMKQNKKRFWQGGHFGPHLTLNLPKTENPKLKWNKQTYKKRVRQSGP